jgi:hypothetical protein
MTKENYIYEKRMKNALNSGSDFSGSVKNLSAFHLLYKDLKIRHTKP